MIGLLTDLHVGASSCAYYQIGALITHKCYKYRGVVVALDTCFTSSDLWYESNKTHPSKEQPWYYILVHDSGGLSTYVAQSNLTKDSTSVPINHPRIDVYFKSFQMGRYQLKENMKYGGCYI